MPPKKARKNIDADQPNSPCATGLANLTGQIDQLNEQLRVADAEKKVSDDVVNSLALQDWDFLIDKASTLRLSIDSQMGELLSSVNQLCNFSRQKKEEMAKQRPKSSQGTRYYPTQERLFKWRESALSVLFQTAEFRTIYHFFVSIFILFTAQLMVNALFDDDGLKFIHMDLIRWNFGKLFSHVIPLSFFLHISLYTLLPTFWVWKSGKLSSIFFHLHYFSIQFVFFFIIPYIISMTFLFTLNVFSLF